MQAAPGGRGCDMELQVGGCLVLVVAWFQKLPVLDW